MSRGTMTRLRMILATPFSIIGIGMMTLASMIGGERMNELVLYALEKAAKETNAKVRGVAGPYPLDFMHEKPRDDNTKQP